MRHTGLGPSVELEAARAETGRALTGFRYAGSKGTLTGSVSTSLRIVMGWRRTSYFAAALGGSTANAPYYSHDLGTWHIVSLDSSCSVRQFVAGTGGESLFTMLTDRGAQASLIQGR
jgi:hypothetical protein